MATLSTSPEYPATGKTVRVSAILQQTGANYWRIWATDAPDGSEIKDALIASASDRNEVFSGDAADVYELLADKSGRYVFAIQEYQQGASSYGGGYSGDPNGYASETKLGSEQQLTISVGTRLTARMGTSKHSATLALWVWEDTVRETTFELHGESTPVILDPTSMQANTASKDSTVLASLVALVDQTATTLCGSLTDAVSDIAAKFNTHIASGAAHSSADSDNTIVDALTTPSTNDRAREALSEFFARFSRHSRDDDGTGAGAGGYHTSGERDDATSVAPGGDTAGLAIAIADAWRVLDGHIGNTTIHSSTTTAPASLPPLLALHRDFLSAALQAAPTAPATANPGAVTLAHRMGMEGS